MFIEKYDNSYNNNNENLKHWNINFVYNKKIISEKKRGKNIIKNNNLLDYYELDKNEKNKLLINLKYKYPSIKPSFFINKFSNIKDEMIKYKNDIKKF